MKLDLLERLHETNFELLALFFVRAAKKGDAKRVKPYVQAMKDNYVYNTTLKIKLNETEKELSSVRTKYLTEIERLRDENQKLKKLTNINTF